MVKSRALFATHTGNTIKMVEIRAQANEHGNHSQTVTEINNTNQQHYLWLHKTLSVCWISVELQQAKPDVINK